MFNQKNMGNEIKVIEICPFKVHDAPTVAICSKTTGGVISSSNCVPHLDCVGEGNCPDWQTYVNTNRILEILRSVHLDA